MSRRTALRQERARARQTSQDGVGGLCRRAGLAIANGDWGEAEALYNRVVAMGVVDANVYNNLATLYERQRIKSDEALDLLRKGCALAPDDENIKKNFLTLLTRKVESLAADRRFREALPLLQERATVDPRSATNQRELGYCHAQLGDLRTAIVYYTRAINLDPEEATYYNDLGLACYELRLLAEAKGAFQQVLNLKPDSVIAYVHLGLLANLTGLPAIAVNMLQRALEIDPNCGEAHSNLALYLRDQGLQQECRSHYVRAIQLKPESTAIYSSYLLSLNDDPHADPAWVAAEHKKFQALVSGGVREIAVQNRNPSKRLRIGYLSPDFRQHSVAYFIFPVIEAHDRSRVEVACYSTSNQEDSLTEKIRSACDLWRQVYRAPDEELAQLIAQDEIDVLVELSGHTNDNRLPMLARRAAPVQMTYLGYPNTTGLDTMDYRVTDAIADPAGVSDGWHTEKLIRIDGGFLAYRAADWAREMPCVPLPAEQTGVFTFGSFNNLAKVNEAVLDSWASILAGVPGSVLLLKAKGLKDERIQGRLRTAFRARGVDDESRVITLGHERSSLEHLKLYHRVDLALDTFPYNGTTTTFEALWMGTPVVALVGATHAGRVGASILSRVGLGELVCDSGKAYVETAVALAEDRTRLKALRTGLRERLLSSPLMDARRLAAGLEAAYAEAWRGYCTGNAQESRKETS
jgi:protein O-GlcNAc transferase